MFSGRGGGGGVSSFFCLCVKQEDFEFYGGLSAVESYCVRYGLSDFVPRGLGKEALVMSVFAVPLTNNRLRSGLRKRDR